MPMWWTLVSESLMKEDFCLSKSRNAMKNNVLSENELIEALGKFNIHDHICQICDTQEEQLEIAVPFIKIGLERGEKCIYVVDYQASQVPINALQNGGIDVKNVLKAGTLSIFDKKQVYLNQGNFDPDKTIQYWQKIIASAKMEGFNALRVVSEATGLLAGNHNIEKFIEYEAMLNCYFPGIDAVAICQYNRKQLPPEVIANIIHTHPKIIYRGLVCDNFYYVPPDELLKPNQKALEVDRFLGNIYTHERNNIALNRENTRRKYAEEELKLQEEKISAILKSVGEGIITINQDSVIQFVNQELCNIFGYSKNEIINQKLEILIPQKYRDDHHKGIENYIKQGKAKILGKRVELEGLQKNGKAVPIDLRIEETIVEKGGQRFFTAAIRDISDRKQKDEQIKMLFQAVEQSASCIVITDTNGNIEYVNPKFNEITGYTLDEVIGQNPRFLKTGKTTDEEYQHLWKTITHGGTWQGEFYNKKKNGEYYWELAQITPMRNQEGVITNFLAIKEDITDIKRTEKERTELREQLFHAQKLESVGRLASGVAHDFNNILTGIIGYANLSQLELQDDDPVREYIHKILSTAEKAATLTQSMLTFSRKQSINARPENMNTIIKNAEIFTTMLMREDIEYILTLSDTNPVVMADNTKIEQVIMNLVSNARDAMPDGGKLMITTGIAEINDEFIKSRGFGTKGNYALISVSDTGTGIDEEQKEKIFDPFFTTKPVGKGTGLGLSIVYGIIKQHEGFIDVQSKCGKGSTFNVYLPLATSKIKAQERNFIQEAFTTRASDNKTILIAEDDESVRYLIKKSLEKFGYTVVIARDGKDAIDKFMEHKDNLDLLILDVKMPGKNGKEAYDEMKKIRPELKAIFLSGYSEDIVDSNIFRKEGLSFIQKPFLPAKLLENVRCALMQ
ncbi:MAG: PAS domain S-box protein [Planctomycetes bacterium]|nr:PAS domain S-box protein [Planctomycetota bacterium]